MKVKIRHSASFHWQQCVNRTSNIQYTMLSYKLTNVTHSFLIFPWFQFYSSVMKCYQSLLESHNRHKETTEGTWDLKLSLPLNPPAVESKWNQIIPVFPTIKARHWLGKLHGWQFTIVTNNSLNQFHQTRPSPGKVEIVSNARKQNLQKQ